MPEFRAPRGDPLHISRRWLIVAAAVSAVWIVWPDVRVPPVDSRGGPNEDPVAAALENLRTVEAVARIGSGGVPELVDLLANQNFRVRRNAMLALRSMGPEASGALVSIRERFSDEHPQVRSMAIEAYWRIRRDADDVSAVVAPMLGDPDAEVLKTAVTVLESIGRPAIAPIVAWIRSGETADRRPALAVLRQIGRNSSEPRIEEVARGLTDDRTLRIDALQTLAACGHPSAAEIRELLLQSDSAQDLPGLYRSEPGPSEMALRAVIRDGPAAHDHLNDLLDLLEKCRRGNDHWNLTLAAVHALQSAARPAEQRLLRLANDQPDFCWIRIGWTLWDIGIDPQQIVRLAEPRLLDQHFDNCFHAGRLLAQASPAEARRQVTRLIPGLVPEKLVGGSSALYALWGLAPVAQEAIPALSRLSECDKPGAGFIAIKTLGDIGPEAVSAVPALVRQLARGYAIERQSVRRAVCEAIGKFGPAARHAVPDLLAELNAATLKIPLTQAGQRPVGQALSALVRIGDSDPPILAAIRRHLNNDDEFLQLAALRALEQLKPNSPEVLKCYLDWLENHRSSRNLVGVILAIGRFTGDRRNAAPVLRDFLADNLTAEIRKAAAWSLGMIGADAVEALPALRALLNDWSSSLNPRRSWSLPQPPSDSGVRNEMGRWSDPVNPLISDLNIPSIRDKSVQQVVSEAIRQIEAAPAATEAARR